MQSATAAATPPHWSRPLSWAVLTSLALLLALSTWFAATQPPHPNLFRTVGNWDFAKADWWLYPLERNAFRRTVIDGTLNDVFALPGSKQVWAVGEGGLIVHSDDGGRTWQQQRLRVAPDTAGAQAGTSSLLPISIAHAADANSSEQQQQQQIDLKQGKVAAGGKTDTAPAGKSPAPPAANNTEQSAPAATLPALPIDRASAHLFDVFFVDAKRGWAVGDSGTLIATSDGGARWQPQVSGTQTPLYSISFAADGKRGWAVGQNGTLIATTDGGATWQPQVSGSESDLDSIHFTADGRHGWAVGSRGTLIATTNGGTTWQPQTSGTQSWLASITFAADGKRGWAAGGDGTIIATTDGGSTWQPQISDTQERLTSISFTADGQRGWAVGVDGILIATVNGGTTWQSQVSGTQQWLNSISFAIDGQRGWAVGQNGALIATTNGGTIWQPQASHTQEWLSSIHFAADGQRGWAVGWDSTLITTRDGGATWQPQVSGIESDLDSIHFTADGRRGWAVGSRGTIIATTNGGSTWQPQDSGTQEWLLDITFASDGQHGWAVGRKGGTLIATTDGGARWQPQASGTQERLNSITFTADGQHGWAVGKGGTLIATTDGGARWQPQTSGTQSWLASITFAADGKRGWAAGGDGTIIATTDGGSTWQPQTSGTQQPLYSITFTTDSQRGWAAGENGTLITTTDGGATWQLQASGTESSLTSIHFAADGQRGWAVGERGTLIATTNGGASWQTGMQPSIGLPPWYWAVLLLLALAGVLLGARGQFGAASAAAAESAAGKHEATGSLWADRPVEDLAQDRLNYRPTVQALSGFIRNAGTEPHLTLAITGEWGQGKSSIMRMLKRDLEQAGFRTAWFNAWHHQQEGRPMSALFNVIRRQAMPSLFGREAIAALRVRWRLLWGRGGAYRLTLPVVLFGLLLAGQDFVRDYSYEGIALSGVERLRWAASHHLLGEQRVRLTPESLARLTPIDASKPAQSAQSNAAAGDSNTAKPTPTSDTATAKSAAEGSLRVRQALIDYLRSALVAGSSDDADSGCRDPRPLPPALRCVFDKAEQLFATIDKHAGLTLTLDERQHLRTVAPPLAAPPVLPRMQWLLVSLGPLLVLLLTKGVSVYGFQLLRPLNGLVNRLTGQAADDKEPTGLIEHYRTEFALLTQALDGRLVLFVDDLDRCNAQTVNSLLELTNYLTDIGQCFIVLGVAIEHIEGSIAPNREGLDNAEYARRYLRKLIHVEVPVPHRMAQTDRLYDPPVNDAPGWLGRMWRTVRRWLPLLTGAAAVGVVLLALPAFDWMNHTLVAAELALDIPAVQGPATSVGTAAPETPVKTVDPNVPPKPDTPAVKTDVPRLSTAARVPLTTLGIAAGALIGTLLLILARRLLPGVASAVNRVLGGAERTFDSAAFVTALRLWHPALVQYDPTPRGVKRFANRARLMALYERLSAEGQQRKPMAEAQVVAVTAIHQVEPEVLDRWANKRGEGGPDGTAHGLGWAAAATDQAATEREALLLGCINEHCKQHGEPTADDIARLHRRMQDVKVR